MKHFALPSLSTSDSSLNASFNNSFSSLMAPYDEDQLPVSQILDLALTIADEVSAVIEADEARKASQQ